MALPDRRTGFSRKAQYSVFFTYLAAVAGIGLAALFVLLSVIDPRGADAMRMTAVEITAPIARTVRSVRDGAVAAGDWVGDYFAAVSTARRLEAEMERARPKLVEAAAIAQENRRLKGLLELTVRQEDDVATGKLIAGTASSSRRLATLSVGSNRNVERGQPVRAREGLVGRVLSVGPTAARVLLITDSDSVVPVKRVSDGLPAIATGLGNGRLQVNPLNVGLNPFQPGDQIVTSGNGGLFPPNIPVAQVLRQQDEGALGRPYADPASVGFVVVMPVYEPRVVEQERSNADEMDVEPTTEAEAAASANR